MGKTWVSLLVVTLCWVSTGGCVSESRVTGRPDGQQSTAVIGHLQTRDELITIRSTAGGPRFSIHTTAGQLVAADLTLEELEARHPGAHSLYESAIAEEGGVLLDASLWPHETPSGRERGFEPSEALPREDIGQREALELHTPEE